MRVLLLTTKNLLPMNSGGLVGSNGMLRFLYDSGYAVTLVNFYEKDDYTSEQITELRHYAEEIYTVKLTWPSVALNLSIRYPNSIRKYTRRGMKKVLSELDSRKHFQIVVIDHVQMYEYAKLFPDARIILHTHNMECNLWYDHAKNCSRISRPLILRNAAMLKEYEKWAFLSADGVLTCSETDREDFRQLAPECNAATMHSYIRFEPVKTEEDIRNRDNSILFIGTYSWEPNADAAEYLIDEVMPELREKLTGIKLYLVGKDPTEAMRMKAQQYGDIIITGMVESIDPYIKKADVFVNTVTKGSGINIKVIEAMGKGIPVISSEFGARGIDAEEGRDFLIYRSCKELTKHIEKVISDKEQAERLSNNARKFYLNFIQPGEDVRRMFEQE